MDVEEVKTLRDCGFYWMRNEMMYPDVEMGCINLYFTLHISGLFVTSSSDLGASSSGSVCRNQVPFILVIFPFLLLLYHLHIYNPHVFPWGTDR